MNSRRTCGLASVANFPTNSPFCPRRPRPPTPRPMPSSRCVQASRFVWKASTRASREASRIEPARVCASRAAAEASPDLLAGRPDDDRGASPASREFAPTRLARPTAVAVRIADVYLDLGAVVGDYAARPSRPSRAARAEARGSAREPLRRFARVSGVARRPQVVATNGETWDRSKAVRSARTASNLVARRSRCEARWWSPSSRHCSEGSSRVDGDRGSDWREHARRRAVAGEEGSTEAASPTSATPEQRQPNETVGPARRHGQELDVASHVLPDRVHVGEVGDERGRKEPSRTEVSTRGKLEVSPRRSACGATGRSNARSRVPS